MQTFFSVDLLKCILEKERHLYEKETWVPCSEIEPLPISVYKIMTVQPTGQGETSLKYRKEDKDGRYHYIFLYGPIQHCNVVYSYMGELQKVFYFLILI